MAKKKPSTKAKKSLNTRRTAAERTQILNMVGKLRKDGKTLPAALKAAGISIGTYYAWSKNGGAAPEAIKTTKVAAPVTVSIDLGNKLIALVGTVDQVIEGLQRLRQ